MSSNLLDRRWPWFAAAALLVVVFLFSLVERRPVDDRPIGTVEDLETLAEREDLNVLFVLVDMLRAERLSAYGYARETSPNIDFLSESGIRFARHLSQSSWTKCSMASMWTGLYPQRTRVLRYNDVLSDQAVMPAEILQDAGYRTIGLWRNGWVAPNFGFAQGFDLYHRPAVLPLKPGELKKNPSADAGGSDESVLESVRSFLVTAPPDRRWFLYLHLMDLHQYTYDSSSALFGTSFSDIYDNSIRRQDNFLSALVYELSEAGELDNTLIVLASDHGEAFGERGFEGHAQNVFRETTEVPFIIIPPFRLDPGIVVEARTRNIDIWPTLLDLLGLPPLEDVDGRSTLPDILAAARGEAPREDVEPSFAQLDQHWGRATGEYSPTIAATLDEYRYVHWEKAGGAEVLFDGREDPDELVDVAPENPDLAEELRVLAEQYLEESPAPPWGDDAPTVELDAMQLNQLRALGYEL